MTDFNGFISLNENWFKAPNELIEVMPLVSTLAELKVILYVMRHTLGYHEDDKKITVDEFQFGRRRRDGSRLDAGTGLAKNSVLSGIKSAIEHNFLEVFIDDTDRGRIKKFYGVKILHPTSPDIAPLISEVQDLDYRGAKIGTIEVQELNPIGSNVAPPTEKETIRKKQKKETNKKKPDFSEISPDSEITQKSQETETAEAEAPELPKGAVADADDPFAIIEPDELERRFDDFRAHLQGMMTKQAYGNVTKGIWYTDEGAGQCLIEFSARASDWVAKFEDKINAAADLAGVSWYVKKAVVE